MEDNRFLEAGLLDRYLAGDVTPEDRARVEAWMALDPARGETIHAIRAGAQTLVDADAEWGRLASKCKDAGPAQYIQVGAGYSGGVSRGWLKGVLATALVMAVVTGCVLGFGVWSSFDTHNRGKAVAYTTYTTGTGQRARIQLVDGSTVTLNAGSRVRYGAGFGKTDRNILLEGEALFAVASHTGLPFNVRTGNLTTRVLGTSFLVRHYPDESAVRVTVAEGKVALEQTVLTVGEAGTAGKQGTSVTRDVNIAAALAWTTGRLVFDKASFREIIPDLSRWYGINIKVLDKSLLDRRINTTLVNETASQAVSLIAQALDAEVKFNAGKAEFFR